MIELEFRGEVFQADDGDAWHWVELSPEVSELVEQFSGGARGGWRSIKVDAQVGSTRWSTSLFESTDGDSFLLPVKATVRRAESIDAGDDITVTLRL